MSKDQTLGTQSLDHGEVLLEVAKSFEHERQELSLAFVFLNKLSFLETFELDEPVINRLLQISRLNPLELAFKPLRDHLVVARGDRPELIQGFEVILDLLEFGEASLGNSEKCFAFVDQNRRHVDFVEGRLELLSHIEGVLDEEGVKLFLGPARALCQPIKADEHGDLVSDKHLFLLLVFAVPNTRVRLLRIVRAQTFEQVIDCLNALLSLLDSELNESFGLHLFDLLLEVKDTFEDEVGFSLHFFDQLILLVKELLLADHDPLVEAAWPVSNVQELGVVVVFKHHLHGVDE